MGKNLPAPCEGEVAGGIAAATMSAVTRAGRMAGFPGDHPPHAVREKAYRVVGMHHEKEGKQDSRAVGLTICLASADRCQGRAETP